LFIVDLFNDAPEQIGSSGNASGFYSGRSRFDTDSPEVLHVFFFQYVQENAGILPKLRHDHFLVYAFHFAFANHAIICHCMV
jgi:hypothetical protein